MKLLENKLIEIRLNKSPKKLEIIIENKGYILKTNKGIKAINNKK